MHGGIIVHITDVSGSIWLRGELNEVSHTPKLARAIPPPEPLDGNDTPIGTF